MHQVQLTMPNTLTTAVRQRRCRARRRQGLAVLRVETNEFRLIDALLATGRLTEEESQRRPLVEKAAAALLEDFAQTWQTWFGK